MEGGREKGWEGKGLGGRAGKEGEMEGEERGEEKGREGKGEGIDTAWPDLSDATDG